jgi:hypothetical protein
MSRLDHDANTPGLKYLINRIGDLRSQSLLDLQSASISLHDPSQLGNANDSAVRDISDPCASNNRCHVMFAMALERYASENDHFVVAIRFFECLPQNLFRVLPVARKIFLVCSDEAGGFFTQPFAIGVLADPPENLPKGLLNISVCVSLSSCILDARNEGESRTTSFIERSIRMSSVGCRSTE